MNKKYIVGIASVLLAGSSMLAATPTYPGGESAIRKYLLENIQYPSRALNNGIEGIICIEAVVNPAGKVVSAKAVNSLDPDLEKEAVRVVMSMSGWEAPMENGSPVEGVATIEVTFQLP